MGPNPLFRAGKGRLLFVFVGLAVLAGGCATLTAERPQRANGRAAEQSLEDARRTIEGGDISAAIPRLVQVMATYPGTQAATDAHYWQGVAYFKLGSFRESIGALEEYERLAPQGTHAAESAKLLAQMAETFSKQFANVQELDAKIQTATQAVAAAPADPAKKMILADLYWMRRDYAKAGEIYAALVTSNPDYRQDPVVCSRVEFRSDNKYVVLTPEELQRRQAQDQPLLITNTSGFASNRDSFTHEHRNYVVTGQAVNRGASPLYGVEVNVTIYGVGNVVFDTNTANLGRLNPGEIRAFSIRFSNFENIENINRYDCQGTFQR